LYYRLSVVQLLLPPLRDRDDDMRLLAQAFLQRFAAQNNKGGLSFGPEAVQAMRQHTWPGNVRELENRVKRAVIMAEGKRLKPQDLELDAPSGAAAQTLKEAREALEREMVQKVLRKHAGKIAPAAAELGVSRPTMYELMEKLGIVRDEKAS
jgi:two-component system NtrC family response regulator